MEKEKNSILNLYRDKGEIEILCCRKICVGYCNFVEWGVIGLVYL